MRKILRNCRGGVLVGVIVIVSISLIWQAVWGQFALTKSAAPVNDGNGKSTISTSYQFSRTEGEKKIETSINTDLESKETKFNMLRIDILPSKSCQDSVLNYRLGGNFSSSEIEITENMEWVIMQGGSVELSDLRFLKIVGDNKKYKEVSSRVETRKFGKTTGIVMIVGGIVTVYSGMLQAVGSDGKEDGSVILGSVVSLAGFILVVSNTQLKHYFTGIEAQEKAIEYNKNLRKKLELNLNVP